MANHSDFELPSPQEKLSFKFIADAMARQPAADLERQKPELALESCGSQVELSSEPLPNLELPIPEMKLVAAELPPEVESGEEIPCQALALPSEKKYFRIGEVSHLLGVEPYVLRYWENEFRSVRPVKSRSGQRVYARKDVETLHYIRHLLHIEKFSIKGAKKKLLEKRKEVRPQILEKRDQALKAMMLELKELIHLVKTDPGTL